MSETLTPANVILSAMLLLEELEMDELFEHAGVPVQLMLDEDAVISARDVIAITDSAKALTGDEALGLHLGQEIGSEMLDTVGMMVATAPTLRDALDQVFRYSPLLSTLGRAELVEEGDSARCVLTLHPEVGPIAPYCREIVFAGLWNTVRRLVRGEFSVRRFTFRHAAPAWADEYARVLGEEAEIVFDAGEDSISFARHLLDLPMARHSPGLYQRLQQEAARRLASRPQVETAAASVRRLIGEQMGLRLIDLPSIAEQMGLTPRTLQRRLQDEGTSFQALHDGCRQERARDYLLGNDDASIEALAAILGYSEPANFYRAFKGWFGLSPNEYRRRHGRA